MEYSNTYNQLEKNRCGGEQPRGEHHRTDPRRLAEILGEQRPAPGTIMNFTVTEGKAVFAKYGFKTP